MKVYCPALLSGRFFPARCTSKDMPGGMNISPPIALGDVPPTARSFVLTLVDENPSVEHFIHWIVINMPARTRELREKSSGVRDRMPEGSMELRNSYGDNGYGGPFLIPGAGLHEYVIRVYALSEESLEIGPLAQLGDIMLQVEGKILDAGSTVGLLQA